MGMDLIFEVRSAKEGGHCARAHGDSIFTEAETWENFAPMSLGRSGHFEDGPLHPQRLHLH
jgi:hypothetical protein